MSSKSSHPSQLEAGVDASDVVNHSFNPAEEEEDSESERAVSLSNEQIHELLQIDDTCSNNSNIHKEVFQNDKKDIPSNERTKKEQQRQIDIKQQSVKNPNTSPLKNHEHDHQQENQDLSLPLKKDKLLKQSEKNPPNQTVQSLSPFRPNPSSTSLAATVSSSSSLSSSLTASSSMSSKASRQSSQSTPLEDNNGIPGPPRPLFRISDTPGAFAAGGSFGSTNPSTISNPDDDEPHPNNSARVEESLRNSPTTSAAINSSSSSIPPPTEAARWQVSDDSTLIQATLVTTPDNNIQDDNSGNVPILTAERVEATKPWPKWKRYTYIGGTVLCLLGLVLGIVAAVVVPQQNVHSNTNSSSYWDVDGRYEKATKQAIYVIVFGSSTSCLEYIAPSLSLQCGNPNAFEESLILLLDDGSTSESMTTITSTEEGTKKDLDMGQATPGDIDIVADDTRQTSRLANQGSSTVCQRDSYTGFSCTFETNIIKTIDGDENASSGRVPYNVTRVPTSSSATPSPIFSNGTTDDGMPEMDSSLSGPALPGSERRLIIACAGTTDEDVVLQASLDRSVASVCQDGFLSEINVTYFGGVASTYLSVGQFCKDKGSYDGWEMDAAKECQAGEDLSFDDSLRYCHETDACVAPQVCAIDDLDCYGFSCDLELGNIHQTKGNVDCVLPIPESLDDVKVGDLRTIVETQLFSRDFLVLDMQGGLQDRNSTALRFPGPDETYLSGTTQQANYVTVWGHATVCDEHGGPVVFINCGSEGVVVILDSQGAVCDRIGANNATCTSPTARTESMVLFACGGDSDGALDATVQLTQPIEPVVCSVPFNTSSSTSTIFGGGMSSYVTLGRFCKNGTSSQWRMDAINATCVAGKSYSIFDNDQALCYGADVCHDSSSSCQVEMQTVGIAFASTSSNLSQCMSLVGISPGLFDDDPGLFRDMWPLVKSELLSGMGFLEGALSASLNTIASGNRYLRGQQN